MRSGGPCVRRGYPTTYSKRLFAAGRPIGSRCSKNEEGTVADEPDRMSVGIEAEGSGALEAVGGLVRSVRPRQWVKNVLVVAAPAAAGVLDDASVWADMLVALVSFVFASAGTYLLNDVADREADASHPAKRHRPVAAEVVPVRVAVGVGVALAGLALAAPIAAGLPLVAVVIAVYLAMTVAYSLGLKQIALLELVLVAAGFVLRPVAGAVAVDVPVSRWFLIVVSAAALHLVATKRFVELRDRSDDYRAVLADYELDMLAEVRYASVAVALAGYLLWAFERSAELTGVPFFELSAVPFALAMFRYTSAVHGGAGEFPEEIVLRDRHILAYGAVWAGLFLAGVYGVGT